MINRMVVSYRVGRDSLEKRLLRGHAESNPRREKVILGPVQQQCESLFRSLDRLEFIPFKVSNRLTLSAMIFIYFRNKIPCTGYYNLSEKTVFAMEPSESLTFAQFLF
jgi:hypothetical protein